MVKNSIALCRVSTKKQMNGTSLETQLAWCRKKAEELDAEIVRVIKVDMSGDIFPKKYRDKILALIEEQSIKYVLVHSIDRLSRSVRHGADLMMEILERESSIVTPAETIDKSSNLLLPNIELAIAQQEHTHIKERTSRGIKHILKSGKYPFKRLPFGIKRNEDGMIETDEKLKPIINDIFTDFISTKNYTATTRKINEKYSEILKKPLRRDKIQRIIRNPIFIGFTSWNGTLFGENGDPKRPNSLLNTVDQELFNKAKEIAESISKRPRKKTLNPLQKILSPLAENYGFDCLMKNLDKLLTLRCPKCCHIGLQMDGSSIDLGNLIQRYRCPTCGHQFRFPSTKQLKRFRTIIPHRCMWCGTADDFHISKSLLHDFVKVTCNKCSNSVLVSVSDAFFSRQLRSQASAA